MAEILLFHHAHGLTQGVTAFAEQLRQSGHVVRTPDLFEGRRFDAVDEGVRYAQGVGFGEIIQRAVRSCESAPAALVYAGFSLGALPAQYLAQTRSGARGALLFHACAPASEFGPAWPDDAPVQVHAMEDDPFFVGDGDLNAARALVATAKSADLFLYKGNGHLFSDSSLAAYDPEAASTLMRRVLDFLARV